MKKVLFLCLTLLTLTSCGVKGALHYPVEQEQTQQP